MRGDGRRMSGVQYRVERFVPRRDGSLKVWRWEAPTYRTGNFGFRLVRVGAASRETLTEVRYGDGTRTKDYPFIGFQADVMTALRALRKDLIRTPLGYAPEYTVTADGLLQVELVSRELSYDAPHAKTPPLDHALPAAWRCPGIKRTAIRSEFFDPETDADAIAHCLSEFAAEAQALNRDVRWLTQQLAEFTRQNADHRRLQAQAVARKRAAAEQLKKTLTDAMKDFNVHDAG